MKVVALEEVSFSDTKNPKTVFNTFTVDDKHYLLNIDNFTQRIQMHLSQKQKSFSGFFFAILKPKLKLKHLQKG